MPLQPKHQPVRIRPPTEAEEHAQWLISEERSQHITQNEKRLAAISVALVTLSIGGFASVKWETERQLKELPPEQEQAWRDGTIKLNKDVE